MPLFDSSNSKLFLDREIVCRTPVFTLEDLIAAKFEDLKNIIKEASPAFYQTIAEMQKEDMPRANEKTCFTLWKYFNRAKYRATPFGRFSGISVVPINQEKDIIILEDCLTAHHFTDWQATELLQYDSADFLTRSSWFITNNTLYKVGNEFRYIHYAEGKFEMSAVSCFPELDFVVNYCLEKKSKDDIYNKLKAAMNLSQASIKRLLAQLVSEQLLITDMTPNVTGDDFFERTQNISSAQAIMPYIIAHREIIEGGYKNQMGNVLPELINFLNRNLSYQVNPNLEVFKSAFQKKFEMGFVPLCMAIDPEIGIGYANLGDAQLKNGTADLSDRFKNRYAFQANDIRYDPLLVFLINKSMTSNVINLEEFEGTGKAERPLPNTFNIILHHWEGSVVVEHIGGCTANALLGRFTISCPAVEDMGKRLAKIEQDANPDVLFFDIAYQAESHIDNVNRRKTLYENELPILTWSCLSESININDILVGVRHSEIVLFSIKYKKRMIPRVPSAYNYNRSDLPLFRFLCDIQHQGIRTDMNFKLNELLPELEHYARVMYKNAIIFPETWLVPEELKKSMLPKTANAEGLFTGWFRRNGVNRPFKVGHTDQTLIIDPARDEDLTAFTIYCRKHTGKPLYISEACIGNNKSVINKSNQPFAAQMILNYYHHDTIYKPLNFSQNDLGNNYWKRMIPPGKDWLYFEIYCHPLRCDELIVNQISTFIKETADQTTKWFFIRFEDGGNHLRLRLKMKYNDSALCLAFQLQNALREELENGLVSDIQIKSYFREIARYGKEHINQVEEFFWHDSQYVLSLLKHKSGKDYFYQAALRTMDRLIALSFPDFRQSIDFVNFMAMSYSKEFSMTTDDYKQLNGQVRTLKFNREKLNNSKNKACYLTQLESLFKKLINQRTDINERYTLTADLLHMHINRLFASNQRVHEAILYQYLFQLLKSRGFARLQEAVEA